jgi:hypothetical protein
MANSSKKAPKMEKSSAAEMTDSEWASVVAPDVNVEEEAELQRRLAQMNDERGEDFDPLSDEEIAKNETNMGVNAKGEQYQRMPWNTWDMYARGGQSEKTYHERNRWNKRMTAMTEQHPRLENETREDYERRMKMEAFASIAAEQADDDSRRVSGVEMDEVRHVFPRNEGEKTDEWAQRIYDETGVRIGRKLDLSGEKPDFVAKAMESSEEQDIAKDAENHENLDASDIKRKLFRENNDLKSWRKRFEVDDKLLDNMTNEDIDDVYDAYSSDLKDFAMNKLGISREDLDEMAKAGNLDKLVADYNKYLHDEAIKNTTEGDESAEEMERLREAMIRDVMSVDLRDMIAAEGVMWDDLEKMSAEELKDMREKIRERMNVAFNSEDLADLLERDNLMMDDIEKMSFEEMRDQREIYRQEFIRDLNDESFADELANRNIEMVDLEQMTLEELIALKKSMSVGNKAPVTSSVIGNKAPVSPDKPLIAVNLNVEKDARDAAHTIAEKMLKQKTLGRGKLYNIIVGGVFREFNVHRYEGKAYKMILEKQRGEATTLGDTDWSTKVGFEQFVDAYITGYEQEMIHGAAGEKMNTYGVDGSEVKRYWTDEDGVRHEEVIDDSDPAAKATRGLRNLIAKYAQDGDKAAFESNIAMLQQELKDAGGNPRDLMAENYMEVAEAARDRLKHTKSIADVMAGFRFINGEARSNVRTEAHRDALDKITNFITNSRIGSIFPPEVVSTAAATATYFGRSGIRKALIAAGTVVVGATMAPATVSLAVGMGMAGVTTAIRERNRVTGDRATNARELARGGDATKIETPTDATRRQKRRLRKMQEYGEKMAETQYDTISAADATEKLRVAIASGDKKSIVEAYAEADTATKLSDSQGIDLIYYDGASSTEINAQRRELDIARAEAKVALRRLGVRDIGTETASAVEAVKDKLENDISAKDKAFRKLRRRRALAVGAKSSIAAGITQIGVQETAAFFDKGQVGLAETGLNKLAEDKFGHAITENSPAARNTFLAGLVGLEQDTASTAILQRGAELSQEQVEELRRNPNMTVVKGQDKVTYRTETVSMKQALEDTGQRKIDLTNSLDYDDPIKSQGAEFFGYEDENGIFTRLSGESYGGGQTVNLDNVTTKQLGFGYRLTKDGDWYYLPATTSGDKIIPDLTGQPDYVRSMMTNRTFDRCLCMYENGVLSDGTVDGSAIWSFNGSGTVPPSVQVQVEDITPTYDVIQNVTGKTAREVAEMAILPGVVSRTELAPLKPGAGNRPRSNVTPPGRVVSNQSGGYY